MINHFCNTDLWRPKYPSGYLQISILFLGLSICVPQLSYGAGDGSTNAFSCALAVRKIGSFLFRTKMRAAVTSAVGLIVFTAPVYPTSDGFSSPVLQTVFFGRDWWKAESSANSPTSIFDQSSRSAFPVTSEFPQGVRMPSTADNQETSK